MNNIKNSLLKSPLLGAVFLTILFMVYILFIAELNFNNIVGLLNVVPLLFIIFAFISYIISVPLNLILYRKMERDLKDTKFFVNMSLFSGFLIGLILAFIDYSLHQSLVKSFFIVIGVCLMTTINANYFLILANIITIKEKKNEITKGK